MLADQLTNIDDEELQKELAELMNEASPVSVSNNLILPEVPSGPIQTQSGAEQNDMKNKKDESRQPISA